MLAGHASSMHAAKANAGTVLSASAPAPRAGAVNRATSVVCQGRAGGSGGDSPLLWGPGGGPPRQQGQPSIILPGRQQPPSVGGRLFIPERGIENILEKGAQALGPELTTITGPNRYRPPAGFMDEDEISPDNEESKKYNPEQMLTRLRARAGRWHTLAKLLPALASQHFNATMVDELTGITPLEQNRWVTAATVYDSLIKSGKVSEEVLEHFDVRGDELLEPFRFLTRDMRVEAALYIVEKNLDPPACEVLARAMKEWERRPQERLGFSPLPADCMAFKHLRDAGECKVPDDIKANLDKAMKAAVTEPARERIEMAADEWLGKEEEPVVAGVAMPGENLSGSRSNLTVLRLDPEDIGVRPLPVLGAYGQAAVSDLDAAPRTSQQGAFGTFTISGAGQEWSWVCLPQWKALAMAQHPVAISLEDCSAVPAVVQALKCKTDEDKRRLRGSGLLVADKGVDVMRYVDESAFYLAASDEGAGGSSPLQIVDGAMVRSGSYVGLAKIVFVARPPLRDTSLGQAGGENTLIQV